MSLAGNLEDLAIVDVIQLLHSTRKSGTLSVIGDKGRSQLVFDQGYIVSANHYNDAVRIGNILVEMEAITTEDLQYALKKQQAANNSPQPLIGLLIEKKLIEKKLAYKGLENLIEMTIVEMIDWQHGTFTLDADKIAINDEYRYVPEKLQQKLNFDTQMVLMDALRIYDEKHKNTGGAKAPSSKGRSPSQSASKQKGSNDTNSPQPDLSADLLGLDALDQLEVLIPETFSSLETFDPSQIHRNRVRELLAEFPADQCEDLVDYLTNKTNIVDNQETTVQEQAVILYSADELIQHGIMSSCNASGIRVFSASTPQELTTRIDQSQDRALSPILVFDCPLASRDGFTKLDLTKLIKDSAHRYPHLHRVQISSPDDYLYALQALANETNTVIPRALAENCRDTFIPDLIQFLESFPIFIQGLCGKQTPNTYPNTDLLHELKQLETETEISSFLLEQTSRHFSRSLLLTRNSGNLLVEKSLGVEGELADGPSDSLVFSVKLEPESLLAQVIERGSIYFDATDDKTIREAIFGEISAPDKSKILLLPLVANDKTVALIYADFGQSSIKKIDTEQLQSIAWLAGLALERVI